MKKHTCPTPVGKRVGDLVEIYNENTFEESIDALERWKKYPRNMYEKNVIVSSWTKVSMRIILERIKGSADK